ncbi:MAG TPA: DNA translocase FtsK 4TM domain-containing protein [Planctomycetota bacterium]|nr:DNA translocase FtsK 4TM domain-containing protein [Planctomycetota bacterium]
MTSDNARETRAIVTGMGLVCFALFAGVSLYTHSPYDVMDYSAAQSHEIENKAGLIGAWLAHHAFCVYGVGAWVIAVLLLVFGGVMCSLRSMEGAFSKSIGAVLLTLLVCAWAGAMDVKGAVSESFPAGPGGLLGGTVLAPPLVSYFGKVGVFLILSAASTLCCLLIAPSLTESLLSMVGRGVVQGLHAGVDYLLGKHATPATAPFTPAEPALAGASSSGVSARRQAIRDENVQDIGSEVSRVNMLPAPDTRKIRIPFGDLPEKGEKSAEKIEKAEKGGGEVTPAKRAKVAEALDEIAAEKLAKSRIDVEEEKPKAEKKSKAELDAISEADEAERRKQEAVRQAEAAEAERLEREKQAKEQFLKEQKEAKAFEKLEKERAEKEAKLAKQQEKFQQAMADAAAAAAKANGTAEKTEEGEAEPEKPKPQLPVNYDLPKFELLFEKDEAPPPDSLGLKERGATLIQTLWDFKLGAKLVGIQTGPTVSMYELELDPGIKVQRVLSLQDNLAMAMKAEHGVRIIAPIPGKATIGIEIPNSEKHKICMRPILESPQFRAKAGTLPLILGRDAVGNPLFPDLATMPHLLIAGTTGSGKSVCLNSIILSLMILKKPHEVKMILVDPKQVEMTDFKGIPHLLCPVVTDMKLASGVLTWAVQKMEQRYERMSRVAVRNIATFNKMTSEERLARLPADVPPDDYIDQMPYIVIIVDEFADLMMTAGKEIEQAIARLAQKARAAGIHVILATQRPSADVVTGLIKTNLPCRICFQVKSKIDSRIVLDTGGAEKLAGHGDMLYIGPGNSNLVRAKGVFTDDKEIKPIVQFCKDQAEPIYSDEIEKVVAQAAQGEDGEPIEENNRQAIELDEKFDEAVEVFLACGRASTSLLQRRMGLGYTRAAKLCDQMEARGIVGPDRGAKGRELLISQEGWDSFKRVRANNNGSAWGPKGSKDNPGAQPAPAPAAAAVMEEEAPKPANIVDPELLKQLPDENTPRDEI